MRGKEKLKFHFGGGLFAPLFAQTKSGKIKHSELNFILVINPYDLVNCQVQLG
ncbi:MAG: hypothetical protein V4613_07830 [Bacteroidota bacterium]